MDLRSLRGITAAQLKVAYDKSPQVRALVDRARASRLYTWLPRPDNLEMHDEQSSFVNSKAKFAIQLGGTGSGKTDGAARKTSIHCLQRKPPRPGCPFWVVGETMDLTIEVCWGEKLSTFIPKAEIRSISWYNRAKAYPDSVLLRNGWRIEFKSYAQGRSRLQSASVGGFWLNEQAPVEIVEEVIGRTRDYDSSGWADFTPLEIDDPEWPRRYANPPPGWRFYHCNVLCNDKLAPGWAERFLAGVDPSLRPTREWGEFRTLAGAIFKPWREETHVIPWRELPPTWHRIRGIDFGFANPFCCLWMARDDDGTWYVYDEHYRAQAIMDEHAQAIKARLWDDHQPWYGRTYGDHDGQGRGELDARGVTVYPASKEDFFKTVSYVYRLLLPRGDGKPSLYVMDNCKNLIREMGSYRLPKPKPERPAQELPVGDDDHAVDALRYALYTDYVMTSGGSVEMLRTADNWRNHAEDYFGNLSILGRRA